MKKIEVQSRGGPDGIFEIRGFSSEELEKMEGVAHGHNWFSMLNDKATFIPTYKALPDPITDEKLLPFWRTIADQEKNATYDLFEHATLSDHNSPSISIQHLCGHYYTPEKYQRVAERLETFGFQCLRSRRKNDGRYDEVWFLSGLWAAKGDLKNAIGVRTFGIDALSTALEFIRHDRSISFGTLDVSVQRLAMPNPE